LVRKARISPKNSVIRKVLKEQISKYYPKLRNLKFLIIEAPQELVEKGVYTFEAHASISTLAERYRQALGYDVELDVEYGLSKKMLPSIIYHELSHIKVKSDGKIGLLKHDSKEFKNRLRRFS
jgi:hypothetical protein